MAKRVLPTWLKKTLEPDGYRIQIKSVMDFMKIFRDDNKCLQYLANLKWGKDGWECLQCGHDEYSFITTRKLIKCKNCHYQESFIANTIMRKTRKPLTEWFWAIYTITTSKTGISAMELYRQLDFGHYGTAWLWLHKIRTAMIEYNRKKMRSSFEVDETYFFTKKAGRGRAMVGEKAIVICAVEIVSSRHRARLASGRIRLRAIPSASSRHIQSFISDHVERGGLIRTDGWRGYLGLDRLGYKHVVEPLHKPEEASKKLPRVHRIFSNLQAWLIETHRFVSKKHLQNYLNEYMFRFNARYDPIGASNSVLTNTTLTTSREYKGFVKPREPIYVNP
jgi:transposase-like protein